MRLTAGLSGAPGIEWRRSDGSIVDKSNSIMFEGPTVEGSFSVTLVLQFSPLLASHAGQYSCHARIDGPNRFEIAIATENVYVQRKFSLNDSISNTFEIIHTPYILCYHQK